MSGEQMVTDSTSQLPGFFGVYLQVADLHRSLSFYCDVLALEVVWNDGALAVLHGHRSPADSLVIREIGKAARHNMGEAGVTPCCDQVSGCLLTDLVPGG